MQSLKRTIPPFLYFTLLSFLTTTLFLLVGIAALQFISVGLTGLGLKVIVFLLLWKGAIVGFITWFMLKYNNDKNRLVWFIGFYLGRFYGFFVGVFLGGGLAERLGASRGIGSIVGAVALYFVGSRTGAKVSAWIGAQMDRILPMTELHPSSRPADVMQVSRWTSIGLILYGAVVPILFVAIGLLMDHYEIRPDSSPEYLPIARSAAILMSILMLSFPWLLKSRWLSRYQAATGSPEGLVHWLGLAFSISPLVWGFLLFIMGASIAELSLFAAASSLAAIVWSAKHARP